MPGFDRDKFLANDRAATRNYARFIESFVRRYFSDDARVADATQSALVQLVTKLEVHDDLSEDEMLRLVSNCAKNALRRQLTQMRRQMVEFESQLHTRSAAEFEALLHQRAELERIEELLDEHNTRDLSVLIATVQGHSSREIAEALDISEGAVRTTTWRLRKKLRLDLSAGQVRDDLVSLARRHRGSRESSRSI